MNNTVFLNHVKLYRIVYRLKNLERKDVLLLTSNQLCGYKLKLAHVFFIIGNLNRFKLTNHWKKYQCKMYKWSQMHTKHHNNYSMIFWKMNRFEKKKKKSSGHQLNYFPQDFQLNKCPFMYGNFQLRSFGHVNISNNFIKFNEFHIELYVLSSAIRCMPKCFGVHQKRVLIS